MNKKEKRAVSPVVATILLIVLVLVIALIVFLWFRNLTKEEVLKFDQNIELVCDKISFRASYSASTKKLSITNDGNVPIYSIKIKAGSGGDYNLVEVPDFKSLGAGKGGEFSADLGTYSSAEIIPVLLGTSSSGEEKSFVCENSGKIIF